MPLTAAPVELADLGEVPCGHREAAVRLLPTDGVREPVAGLLHAQRLDEFVGHILRDRAAGSSYQEHAEGLGVGRVVATQGCRFEFAHHARHELVEGCLASRDGTESVYVGRGVAVILNPARPRRHLQDVLNSHTVVGRPGEARSVAVDRIVDAVDVAFAHCDADQRRYETFRDGPRDPLHVPSAGQGVVLVANLAVLEDEQSGRVALVEKARRVVRVAEKVMGCRQDERSPLRKGVGRRRWPHRHGGEEVVHAVEEVVHRGAGEEAGFGRLGFAHRRHRRKVDAEEPSLRTELEEDDPTGEVVVGRCGDVPAVLFGKGSNDRFGSVLLMDCDGPLRCDWRVAILE